MLGDGTLHKNGVMWQLNEERARALRGVTASDQLIRQSRVYHPRRKERLFFNMGDLLIQLGSKLKARYEPAIHEAAECRPEWDLCTPIARHRRSLREGNPVL